MNRDQRQEVGARYLIGEFSRFCLKARSSSSLRDTPRYARIEGPEVGSSLMSAHIKVLYILLTIGAAGFLVIAVPRLVGTLTILDVRVHRVNDMGRVVDSWHVFGPHRTRPLAVPTWTPTEYRVGNVRIDVRIRNDVGYTISFRFDTQTLGRKTLTAGKRVSTNSEPVQPGAQLVLVHRIRMWAENITQECWIVNSETGEEVAHFHFNLDMSSTRNAGE